MNSVEVIRWERHALVKVVEEQVHRESALRGCPVDHSDPVIVRRITDFILHHGAEMRVCAEEALAGRK